MWANNEEVMTMTRVFLGLVAGGVGMLLVACGGQQGAASTPGAPGAASGVAGQGGGSPPVTVSTAVARQRDLPLVLEATGTVMPVASVEIKPQLTSVVTKVHVREGQFVRAGELLFTLDTRTDEAKVAQARAAMAKDQAALADAQRQLARSRELLAQGFVAQGALDTAQALVDTNAALVAADRAAVDAARVALAYGQVRAPSAGRVGVVAAYPGTAVQANVTALLTITQLDPIDVSFSVPQRHLADVLAALPAGAPVHARLPDGGTRFTGRLQFVDNAVDASSGAVKLKARFDNRGSAGRGAPALWPGAFVQTELTVRTLKGAVVIPQAAVIQSAKGALVYVVEDGKAVARPLQVVATEGEDAAVSGVRAGERIVLEGRANLRPGVAVVERQPSPSPAPAASAPAAKASS
jgi:RND family efflux transporter MFP subunit